MFKYGQTSNAPAAVIDNNEGTPTLQVTNNTFCCGTILSFTSYTSIVNIGSATVGITESKFYGKLPSDVSNFNIDTVNNEFGYGCEWCDLLEFPTFWNVFNEKCPLQGYGIDRKFDNIRNEKYVLSDCSISQPINSDNFVKLTYASASPSVLIERCKFDSMIQWDNGLHYGILINNASNISIIDCDFKTSSVYNQRVLSITCRPSGDVVGILIEGVKVSGFTMQDTESLADSSIFRVNCSNAHFIFSDSIFQSNTGQISITADHELQLENITVDSSGNNQAELVYISTPSVSI